ncbi:hypothetical protein [Teredinibacter sp. KSP-S5-2]|uniref:hypothetical protein n=1 Tax=Teredinibacter sp. KSP-S5-2 TaxID=3034506 RepID=UPI002934DAFE|nr:hypothetical protein [Teredinibacter sp. KSP-S5-2]WNO08904.1 hypothetical protein P5V12_18310 [Teredinibacter sp. KSP-S5-2]
MKAFTQIFILTFIMILLSACGGSSNSSTQQNATDQSSPTPTPTPTPKDIAEEELIFPKAIPTEVIGPAPSATKHRHITYIPNGDSWNILIPYSQDYVGSGAIVSFNLDNKQASTVTAGYIRPENRTQDDPVYDINYSPRLGTKRFIYTDKVVMPLQTKDQNEIILTYDIASNSFNTPFEIPEADFMMLTSDANKDGIIRASGRTKDEKHLLFYQYNPFTQELTMSSKFPIEHDGLSEYSFNMTRAVGDWLIAGWGGYPWRLVGYNFKTGLWKTFLEVPGKGSYKTFQMYKQKDQSILIFSEEVFDQPDSMKYWQFIPTDDGDLIPTNLREGDQAANLDEHPLQEKYYFFGSIINTLYIHPDVKEGANALPLLDENSIYPDHDGKIRYQYNYKGKDETVIANMQPFKATYRIVGTTGNYLYGAAAQYGDHIFYNPTSGETHTFSARHLSVYSMNSIDNKVYIAGYPNFVIREYDIPTMTYKDSGSNQDVKTHWPLAGIEKGIDNKIYYAGQYYRTRDGGGIAWYEPENNFVSGLPIDKYKPISMVSILDGRFMVMTCLEDGGKLAIFDVEKSELTMNSVPGLNPGYIVGIGNHIIGYGISTEAGPIIYRMNPLTHEIIWQFKIPRAPNFTSSLLRTKHYIMTYDNQDSVYISASSTLLKVNVNTAVTTIFGRVSAPWNITIHNGEIYQAGEEGFTRLVLP